MATSCEMKEGEVYFCEICGIQFEVHKECNTLSIHKSECHPVMCCGKALKKKRV